jgi:integrase
LGPDGKERARHFPTRAAAKRWEAEQLAARERGQFIDPSSKTTLGDYAMQWAASRPYRSTSAERVESMFRLHLVATSLGQRRLVNVRPSEVQTWITERSLFLAPATLRLLLNLLKAVYNSAVLDRLVATSPVVRISLAAHEPDKIVPLTVEQVDALADAVPDRCRAMIIAQAGLGLRISELLGLRGEDVLWLERMVKIEVQRDRHTLGLAPPKTPRSRRKIPLPQVVADALSQHIAKYPPGEDGAIFTMENGEPWKQNHIHRRIMKPAVKRAGLPPNTTTHDLRHSYASWLLQAGESVVTVAERLGHSSATMVLKTYGHVVPNQEDRTRQAIDRLWATAETDQKRTGKIIRAVDQP